jgi:hypothetical protein
MLQDEFVAVEDGPEGIGQGPDSIALPQQQQLVGRIDLF